MRWLVVASLGELDKAGGPRREVGVNRRCEMGEAVKQRVGWGIQMLIGNAEDLSIPDGAERLPLTLLNNAG